MEKGQVLWERVDKRFTVHFYFIHSGDASKTDRRDMSRVDRILHCSVKVALHLHLVHYSKYCSRNGEGDSNRELQQKLPADPYLNGNPHPTDFGVIEFYSLSLFLYTFHETMTTTRTRTNDDDDPEKRLIHQAFSDQPELARQIIEATGKYKHTRQ